MATYSGFPDISASTSIKPKKCKAKDILGNKCECISTHPISGYCDEHQKQYEEQYKAHTDKLEQIARQKQEEQKRSNINLILLNWL